MSDDERITRIERALLKAARDRYVMAQALAVLLRGDERTGMAATAIERLERVGELPPPPPTATGSGASALGLVAAAERSNRGRR